MNSPMLDQRMEGDKARGVDPGGQSLYRGRYGGSLER